MMGRKFFFYNFNNGRKFGIPCKLSIAPYHFIIQITSDFPSPSPPPLVYIIYTGHKINIKSPFIRQILLSLIISDTPSLFYHVKILPSQTIYIL